MYHVTVNTGTDSARTELVTDDCTEAEDTMWELAEQGYDDCAVCNDTGQVVMTTA